MKKSLAFVVAALAIGNSAARVEERQADAPLVVNGDVSLTTSDFEAYLRRMPEHLRADFRTGSQRVRTTVDGLWVQRMFATQSRRQGFDQDPVVVLRAKQAQEAVFADVYMEHLIKDLKFPDLEARARELYTANPEEFREPEMVSTQHILVSPRWRTPEQALERAAKIREEVVAGKEDFSAIAKRLSEDPGVSRNQGNLPATAPKDLAPEFAAAVAKMKKPGEISEPVRTEFGYHIIRFVGRKPERLRTFEEAKKEIIASEKQKIIDEARKSAMDAVRSDPKTTLYLENVEAISAVPAKASDAAAMSRLEPGKR